MNRVNNIECRKITSKHYSHEILFWYPNHYYGKENEYKLSISGDFYTPKDSPNHFIDKGCFKEPESCYVVALLVKTSDGFDMKTVGNRLLELDTKEKEDFYTVYKKAVKFK